MPSEWKEIARLSFKGERFRDHALDLTALTELSRFQKLIADTAKALWKAANPNRMKLPAHFEERTRLCLRNIEDGSATTPLEVYLEEPEKPELFDREPFDDLTRAVDVAYRVFSAAADDAELPDEFPRDLVAEYARWGESLAENESVEFSVAGGNCGVHITHESRERLARRVESPYQDAVAVTGEVVEADVRRQQFHILLPEGYAAKVSFTEAQETEVTTALRDHRAVQLLVRGRGEYLPGGRLQRILHVDELQVVRPDAAVFDDCARSIEDELADLAAEVPAEEWNAIPSDLTDHLDHYLYGTAKE